MLGLEAVEEFDAKQLIRCACGCGEFILRYYKGYQCYERKFMRGHNWKGKFHYKWKGGTKISKGYIYIKKPDHRFADIDGYVRKHRLVYETYHKCCLLPWAVIHHKNGDTKDNRPTNLQLVNNREHGHLHKQKLDTSDRFCNVCNVTKTGHWYTDGLDKWLCLRCYDMRRYYKIKLSL